MSTNTEIKKPAKIVFVVDDDGAHTRACERILTQSGYEVVTASNGAAALRALADWTVDLLLVDVFMPEADGIEVIREVRRKNPHVVIIAMSGGGQHRVASDVLALCAKLGARAVLEKPFDAGRLTDAVAAALRPI